LNETNSEKNTLRLLEETSLKIKKYPTTFSYIFIQQKAEMQSIMELYRNKPQKNTKLLSV